MTNTADSDPDLQKLAQQMYDAVTKSYICWGRLENSMAGLLEWLIGYSSDNVGLHVYFAPSNTETRFAIVDAAARAKWKNYKAHDLFSEWQDIKISIDRAKLSRNRIAHGQIDVRSRMSKGKSKWQARLTASSWDIGRTHAEHKPRQWPGMSVHDVTSAADRFFWLAVRVDEMKEYWKCHNLRQNATLPARFASIVERRQNRGADLKSQPLKRGRPK